MSWLYLYAFLFIFSSISFLSPSALPYKYSCCSAGCPYNFAARHCPLMYGRIISSISKPLPSQHLQLFSQKMKTVDNLFRI